MLDPGRREQAFQFVFAGVVHEFFEDPFEVGIRIEAVLADLFDEGVDDCTPPAGVFPTKKSSHPEGVSPSGFSQNRT